MKQGKLVHSTAWLTGIAWAAAATLAQAALPARSISVTGESVVFIKPDRVDVCIGVEMFAEDPEAVAALSETAAERMLSAIRDLGVADRQIQTQALKMEIRYRDGEPHKGIAGYLVRREYVVTLSDPSMASTMVATALSNGANLLLNVDYRSSDPRQYRDQARRMAVKAAHEKAALMAGELDEQVGRPQTISETSFGYFGNFNSFGANSTQNAYQIDSTRLTQGDSIPAGQIAVQANVSITFDLTEKDGATASAD